MNLTILPHTDVYSKFSVPSVQNKVEGMPRPAKTEASQKTKIPLKKTIILAAVVAIGGGIAYYKKGVKAIKLADETPLLKKTKDEFTSYIQNGIHTQEEIDILKKQRKNYEKFSKNFVGKLHRGLRAVSKFFKDNFYNY